MLHSSYRRATFKGYFLDKLQGHFLQMVINGNGSTFKGVNS